MTTMKKSNKWTIFIFLSFALFLNPPHLTARLNFDSLDQAKINLETVKISKNQFFVFVKNMVEALPPGLGTYGRVPFHPCDIKINNQKLFNQFNEKGIKLNYLSNPSCDQAIISKLLEQNYDFQKKNLSKYNHRRCILSIENILSPIFEYYTIIYEEKSKKECPQCNEMEQSRLTKIITYQKKIEDSCESEYNSTKEFLNALNNILDQTYSNKAKMKRK